MSCDEFYHRHYHKKVTHTHPHSDDMHHHHTHPEGQNGHDHPEAASSGDPNHLHEHIHEAAEHQHPSEHDLLHPSEEVGFSFKRKNLPNKKKDHTMRDHEPIKTEEK